MPTTIMPWHFKYSSLARFKLKFKLCDILEVTGTQGAFYHGVARREGQLRPSLGGPKVAASRLAALSGSASGSWASPE